VTNGASAGKAKASAGFVLLPNWVLRDSNLDANELLVYLALFNHIDKDGYAHPGKTRIAKEARMSVATVKRTLPKLAERGLISIQHRPLEHGKHDSNRYRVATFERERPVDNSALLAASAVQFVHTPVHSDPTPGSQGADPGVTVSPKEDPLEEDPLEEDSEVGTASRRDFSFSDPSSDKASQGQLDYLKDLHIHYANELPTAVATRQWSELTSGRATHVINEYLKRIPRYDSYEGPEYGDDLYNKLSDKGKEWADTGFIPEMSAF